MLGGDAKHVLVANPDYLRANTGVMLLRVHPWSLALIDRLLATGAPRVRRRNALAAQVFVGKGMNPGALCYLWHRGGLSYLWEGKESGR